MHRVRAAALLLPGLMVIACEPNAATQRAASVQPGAAPAEALIAGTPAGDLEDWVADIRSGLDSVKLILADNRAEAHRRVLDLYVTRQEYLEMYYGPGGRMQPSAELMTAVKLNETRLHELMRLTGATPQAEQAAIDTAIDAALRQLDAVLANAGGSERRVRGTASTTRRAP